ncbi:TFIIB-type zinc ribbon-containing protein [Lentzea sp. NPDC051838]|uniref:TFIIB-type zinc ribbon-containing protein n=1 Tax=Lentzea sp. NPDC051838 TaxID=3154849 RepID=UPI003433554A
MTRHRDSGACLCELATHPVLVKCPSCTAQAVVTSARLVCPACAHTHAYQRTWCWDDQRFVPDLWLQTPCAGHTLWALNPEHLDLLESYVSATLREDPLPTVVRRMTTLSKLPAWLKSAKNRDEVLRAIRRLRATVRGAPHRSPRAPAR